VSSVPPSHGAALYIYEEVEFKLGGQRKMIKIRPRAYVRKDCEEAIEKLIHGTDETIGKTFTVIINR